MRHKLPLLFLIPLLLLQSCGVISAVREARDVIKENKAEMAATISSVKEVVGFVRDVVDKVRPMIEHMDLGGLGQMASQLMSMKDEMKSAMSELKAANSAAFDKADKNHDGKLGGIGEWLAYILAGGAGAAEIVRRLLARVKQQVLEQSGAQLAAHVERLDGRIEHERAKRKELEAQQIAELKEAAGEDPAKVGFDPAKK